VPVLALLWLTVLSVGSAAGPPAVSVVHQKIGEARGSAWITVSGSVLSIESRHGILILNHGPLETAPRGTVECVFSNKRNLFGFHRGDWIMALARTDHHPWVLRNPRIIREPSNVNTKVALARSFQAPRGAT
jgi:hypothetical protein